MYLKENIRLKCTIRPDHVQEMEVSVCKSSYEMHAYLAKRKTPVSDLTSWEFQLGDCVPWSEEICFVISKMRKKRRNIMEIWRHGTHNTAGLYLWYFKFGEVWGKKVMQTA